MSPWQRIGCDGERARHGRRRLRPRGLLPAPAEGIATEISASTETNSLASPLGGEGKGEEVLRNSNRR